MIFDINWFRCSVAGFDDKLACRGLPLKPEELSFFKITNDGWPLIV